MHSSTYNIYSPEALAVWKKTGQSRYPNMHVWVEGIGKHIFDTERDVFSSIPLNIKIAGSASSARGNVQLNVSPTDKTWYADVCNTISEMVGKPSRSVSLKNSLGMEINDLTIDQLAHTGEIDVYIDGTRHLVSSDASKVPKVPRHASPHKIEHLTDWYEGHRDELCNFVSDQMQGWSKEEVENNLVDGGKLERAICKHIENECHGPDGETWDRVVSTYGMDRNARGASPHRAAQAISKELIEQLCLMLQASRDQVVAFYGAQARRAAKEGGGEGVPKQRSIFEDPKKDAPIPLRGAASAGVDTDHWTTAKDMYSDLAMDAFDQPALRDRIVVLLHRQPHQDVLSGAGGNGARDPMNGGAPKRDEASTTKRAKASPLGNPVKELITEYHMPYYGKHAMEGDSVTKKTPFYGKYHKTIDAYHLYTGRHPHPMSMIEEGALYQQTSTAPATTSRLERIPAALKKKSGSSRARFVPIEDDVDVADVACMAHRNKKKKEEEEEEDDDEDDDTYGGKYREYHGGKKKSESRGDNYWKHSREKQTVSSVIGEIKTLDDFVEEFGGGSYSKARQAAHSILGDKREKLTHAQRSFFNRYLVQLDSPGLAKKAVLVPVERTTSRNAVLVPMEKEPFRKAVLVPISDSEEDMEIGDGLPDLDDFL